MKNHLLKRRLSHIPRFLVRIGRSPLLTLCTVALFLALGAGIAHSQSVTISLPDTALPNNTSNVSMPIKVTGFYHIGSFSLTITFDPNVVQYVSVSGQPSIGIFNATPVASANSQGKIAFSWFNVSPALNNGSGTLMTPVFSLKTGYSDLTFNTAPANVTDSLGNNISATYTNGRLSGPPGTPSLTSPANNATGVSATPTLTWVASPVAKTYRLQLSTDASFATTIIDDATLTTASKQPGTLSGNTTYYWRVSATNGGGTSAFSTISSFTTAAAPPAPPTLTAPANGATGQATNVTLSWFASPGANSYRLQVSTDQTFATTFYDQSNLTGTSQAMSGLQLNTTYYWRVNATSTTQGTSAYSSTYNFKTTAGIPSVPTLISPASGATNQPLTVTLTWSAVTGASWYEVRVGTDSLVASAIIDSNHVSGTSLTIQALSPSTKYYWRVNASNSSGSSNFADAFSFTTGIAPPAAPTLASPANGATNQASNVTLSWNASTGATSYHLQVSTDQNFVTTVSDLSNLTGTSQAMSGLLSSTTYYWHVSASNSGGSSAYSTTRSFTTTVVAPSAPTLATPANGATNQSTSLTLTWNASVGAASYQLQVSTDQAFGTTIFDQSGLTGTSQAISGLSSGTTYYWHVNATNSAGTSSYSSAFSFTTSAGSPAVLGVNLPDMVAVVGSAITVPVGVTAFNHIGSLSLAVAFDKTVLTYTGVANQPSFGIFNSTPAATVNANGSVTISWFNVSPALNIGTGTLLNLLFTYKGGTSTLTFTNKTPSAITDSLGNNLTTTYTDGSVRDAASVPPSAPSLLLPADGATNLSIPPTLSWTSVVGATSYRLQVSTAQSFSSTVYDQSNLTGTSQSVSGLSGGTTYYWRVSASNSAGTSLYSAVRSFSTPVAAPAAPTLSSPANSATGVALTTTLSWNASTGATTYRLQVSTSSGFGTTLVDDSTLTGTSRQVAGLTNNTVYYWRVSAKNAGGSSAFSTAFSFTTIVAAPASPSLTSPANGATGVALTTTLSWNASSGATSYRVQLSTVQNFSSTVVDDSTLATTSRQVTGLTNNTTYYWRVSAKNAGGSSSFSSAFSFTTIVALPAVPVLTTPSDTSINLQLSTTLSWSAATGASTYHLQLSTSSAFTTNLVDDTTITGTSRVVIGLTLNTTYYWRVRSKNAAGYSAFSAARKFTTIRTTDVEQLGGIIPTEYGLSQNYPNPFNPSTTIQYSIPVGGFVSIKVYDVLGHELLELVGQHQQPGTYVVRFDAHMLPSGMYLYQLRAGTFTQTKRMILEK